MDGTSVQHEWLIALASMSAAAAASAASELNLAQFGPFAAAIAIAWLLLLRSDKQLSAERADSRQEVTDARDGARQEIERLTRMLELERREHHETRAQLIEALKKLHGNHPPDSND